MRRFSSIILGVFLPLIASAQGFHLTDTGWSCTGFVGCGYSGNAVTFLTAKVIALVFPSSGGPGFLFWLVIVVFLYGALRMTLSRGEEGKETGKKAMMYAVAGFVLAIMVGMIMRFFCDYMYALGQGALPTFGGGICAVWWP